MKPIILLAALAMPLALNAAPVAVNSQTVSRTVAVADLNLATPAGVAALDRRVAQAVREICGSRSGLTLHQSRAIQRCRVEALASVAPSRRALLASTGEVAIAMVR